MPSFLHEDSPSPPLPMPALSTFVRAQVVITNVILKCQ